MQNNNLFLNCFNMTRLLLFSITILFAAQLWADHAQNVVVLSNKNGSHLENYAPADMPDVYYDSDEDEIIIIADGFSSYYDVYIIRNTPYQTVISTQVSGYGDTIDISSLSDGSYTIVIISEFLNEFEGQFVII